MVEYALDVLAESHVQLVHGSFPADLGPSYRSLGDGPDIDISHAREAPITR
ncbi:hypothetical protein [Nocardia sp. NBC_00403]|uniref:hypothetical protein n=1 Tax=Nocardia sp. NBC_00403 TaxID=2975990 RepID=UPI002E22906D